jgi:hypothetical protein
MSDDPKTPDPVNIANHLQSVNEPPGSEVIPPTEPTPKPKPEPAPAPKPVPEPVPPAPSPGPAAAKSHRGTPSKTLSNKRSEAAKRRRHAANMALHEMTR